MLNRYILTKNTRTGVITHFNTQKGVEVAIKNDRRIGVCHLKYKVVICESGDLPETMKTF